MGTEIDLNVYPYHDDYDESKDYAKIVFKPTVSVQTRELIQLQDILQKQIERFGDNVFKSGTIIEGCNFSFLTNYPYVKLIDVETDGTTTVPGDYVGMFATSNTGLRAYVHDYQNGYESTDPDLKTLYLRYNNTGSDGSAVFSPGQVITITDANVSLQKVRVDNGGLGFSNSDQLVITPALVVNVSSGSFTNGEYVTQPSVGSNLQIIWIDDTSLSLKGQVILGLRPPSAALANGQVNAASWSVANSVSLVNASNTAAATVERVLGTGAAGSVTTDGSGRIVSTSLTSRGSGYSNTPYVSVRSPGNASGISSLSLTGVNYRAKVQIANTASGVGSGYAFSVGKGVVYQKGYFLRVAPQTVIVSKYDQSPNNVVAGFSAFESIVDANQDPSLNDPLAGDNYDAPGADRLRIQTVLSAVYKDAISPSDNFLSVIEWNSGQPVYVNQATSYSAVGDEMARRTRESAGDYVTDPFLVTTKSPSNTALEGSSIDVVVDPGTGYVSGYRVSTQANYTVSVTKGIDSRVSNSTLVSLNYGSWVLVDQYGGSFDFAQGGDVSLRSSPSTFISSYGSTPTGAGSEIGTAKVRCVVYDDGVPGTGAATYRLYLFDIQMNPGRTFRDVRSISSDSGVADVVLERDPTSAANVAILHDSGTSRLLFPSGVTSLKNANNATYTYRTGTVNSTSNTGTLVLSLASSPNEFFLYRGSLTNDEMQDLTVVPLANMVSNASLASVSISSGSSTIVANGAASFITGLRAGDYVHFSGNTAEQAIGRVASIANNTQLTLEPGGGGFTNASATMSRCFPMNVPVPFGRRAGLIADCDANSNILTLNFGSGFKGTGVSTSVDYNVERTGVSPQTKTASRDRYVKIAVANNSGGTTGPWCLGFPDVLRLKGVWLGSDSSVSESGLNVTDDFLVDTNQTTNYLDLGWLTRVPGSSLSLETGDWLLVKFDHLTGSGAGFYATPSYVSANAAQVSAVDSLPLANLTTQINSHEIPSLYSTSGKRWDLTSAIDFRPPAANTVPSVANSASAPVNPSDSVSFSSVPDNKFPLPGTSVLLDLEYYQGRNDGVIIGKDGNIVVLKGVPAEAESKRFTPNRPADSFMLDVVSVPPYPTLPMKPSKALAEILDTRRICEAGDSERNRERTASTTLTGDQISRNQPAQFSMAAIGSLSHRIEALEYYASLSTLETSLKDRTIPSSVDGQDRFKFGFLVDDFADDSLLDTANPQYSADVVDGFLTPKKFSLKVVQSTTSTQFPPFIDFEIASQGNATNSTSSSSGSTVVSNTVPGPGTSNSVVVDSGNTFTNVYTYSTYNFTDVGPSTRIVTLSSVPGTVTIYYAIEQSQLYANTDANPPDVFTIYRGNQLFLTDYDSQQLIDSEKLRMQGYYETYYANTSFLRDYYTLGKFSWNYVPTDGRTFTIMLDVNRDTTWSYTIEYPIGVDQVPAPSQPSTRPAVQYEGVMRVQPVAEIGSIGSSQYHTYDFSVDAYIVRASGLKPLTPHAFLVAGEAYSGDGVVEYSTGGEGFTPDQYGRLVFNYYPRTAVAAGSDTSAGRVFELIGDNSYANTEFTW